MLITCTLLQIGVLLLTNCNVFCFERHTRDMPYRLLQIFTNKMRILPVLGGKLTTAGKFLGKRVYIT